MQNCQLDETAQCRTDGRLIKLNEIERNCSLFFASSRHYLHREITTEPFGIMRQFHHHFMNNFFDSGFVLLFLACALEQCFPTFFGSRHPCMAKKGFGGTVSYNVLVEKVSSSIFGGTPRTFQGIQGCCGTPVGNHCL